MGRVWAHVSMVLAIAVFVFAGPPMRAQQKTDQPPASGQTAQPDDPDEASIEQAKDAAEKSGLRPDDNDSSGDDYDDPWPDNSGVDDEDPNAGPFGHVMTEAEIAAFCKVFPDWAMCAGYQPSGNPLADPPVQPEDVVPIQGDSAPPPDEIMDGGWDEPAPLLSGPSVDLPAAAFKKPLRVYDTYKDGTIRLRIFTPRGLSAQQRARLTHLHGVLQPLNSQATPMLTSIVAGIAPRGSGLHVTTVILRAFCVEPKKLAPSASTAFRWAPRATQAQYAPMRPVRRVSEFLAARGYFKPQGNAEAYGRSITQYAVWTKLEHWDRGRFTDELIRRSRETAKAGRQPWTAESERTLRAFAPLRWKDVRLSILVADRLHADARTKRGVL